MAGMISMNTHFKGVLGFRGVFDVDSFIVELWYDLQQGSGSTMSSISCLIFSVSPASSDLVDLWTNLWCKNSKETFLSGIYFCNFYFSFIFTKNACFSCALCSNVASFCSLDPTNTLLNPLWNIQGCYEFIN